MTPGQFEALIDTIAYGFVYVSILVAILGAFIIVFLIEIRDAIGNKDAS